MFDQLLNLIKEHTGNAMTANTDIPADQHEAVAGTAASSIIDTLKNMLSGGGASQVLNLFHGENNAQDISNHPVTQNVSSNLIGNLMSKFGMSSDKAGGIAGSLIPMIMNKLVNKTNDPNDSSFSLQGIFNSLSGNKTGGLDIGGLVSKFGGSGMDKNHDGKVDLGDLKAAFSGGSGGNESSGGGGIMDTLSGLFGK